MSKNVDFDRIFGIGDDEQTQVALRTNYHRRLLSDVNRFVDAAEAPLGRPLDETRALLRTLEGKRLSPGMALAHVRLLELGEASQPIDRSALADAIDLLEHVLVTRPTAPAFTVDTLNGTERWEREFIAFCSLEMDKTVRYYDDPIEGERVAALSEDRLRHYRGVVSSVLGAIKTVAPRSYLDVVELISDLRIFTGTRLRGASSPSYFGAVFIREPEASSADDEWLWFADHLTHEASHHRLYIACADDTFVTEDRTIVSPVRSDPRPMSGVMHALWVETRLLQTFRALSSIQSDLPLKQKSLVDSYADGFGGLLRKCVTSIETNADVLTPVGRRLLDHCAGVSRSLS